jgi:hypothetical protein
MLLEKVYLSHCEKCDHAMTCAILNSDVCNSFAAAVGTNFTADARTEDSLKERFYESAAA